MATEIWPVWLAAAPVFVAVTCGYAGIPSQSVRSGKMATMKASDRQRRDAQVMQLFYAGASYRAIAEAVGLRSKSTVGQIVERQLGEAAEQRELVSGESRTVWLERHERIWRANYAAAVAGDRYAISEARRLLAQFATMHGLARPVTLADTGRLEVDVDDDGQDDTQPDSMDELARLRYNRAMGLPPNARHNAV